MTRAKIAGGVVFAVVLILLALAAARWALARWALERESEPVAATPPASTAASTAVAEGADRSFLYGRVVTEDGATYEGRLRFGGGEEAFWGDFFNGFKKENPWVAHLPGGRLTERVPVELFGVVIAHRERAIDLGRPFMMRFGDIARIEGHGREVRVTLKSGTAFVLDRFEAGDFDDGVRVWDARRGVVDLDSGVEDLERGRVRTIELLPTPVLDTAGLGDVPDRLYGTVRTREGEFTGFVQWNREKGVGSDELFGDTPGGEAGLRFDSIRSIARPSPFSVRVTQRDGREITLSGNSRIGDGHRGIYVDDRRYGRVLVSWDAFERVDFDPAPAGPAYDDFPPGSPLTGSVVTTSGRRLAGRLVYDLDESETTETLDAPSRGVDYTIPFGLVASIAVPGPEDRGAQHAAVTLHDGAELELELRGDLGERNAGMLIFVDGREQPEYVPWAEIERVELDRPPAMYPPLETGADRS